MLVADESEIATLLACPACRAPLCRPDGDANPAFACTGTDCALTGKPFDRVDGKSLLVDFAHSVLDRDTMLASGGASVIHRGGRVSDRVIALLDGNNPIAPYFAGRMVTDVVRIGAAEGRRPTILVVGGGTIGGGADDLYTAPDVDVVAFDVYASPNVTFLADGHAMPLVEGSVDGVWIQAVLEHVADPIDVVAEIRRVLRPGGFVFADTPFLWPVHEKAYDFTRWTPSGHRWLFRDFEALAAGTSSGPGTLARLALRHLLASLFRSNKAGHLLALPFFWLRHLDGFCDERRGLDAAAGLFFYGSKTARPLGIRGLIDFYDEQIALQRQVPAFRKASRRRA